MSSTIAGARSGRALTDPDDAGVRILRRLLQSFGGSAAFRTWTGATHVVGSGTPAFTLVVHDPAILRALVLRPSPLLLAQAYFFGRVDFEGDLFAALGLKRHFTTLALSLRARVALLRDALLLPVRAGAAARRRTAASLRRERQFRHRHSRRSDQDAITFHYDASNEFYRLWLDEQMVYSCAVFESPCDTIDQAQCNKLDTICRKLRLRPGERFLDIGCGWGALVCWAARNYGVHAHGITLSRSQLELARQRVAALGLQDRVVVELRDYRDLAGEAGYDKIASIGMFEHVGLANLPLYSSTVHRVLRPGGLFLNHGITRDEEGWRKSLETEFINRFVFPDAEVDTVSNIQRGMEHAGFEIHDVEGLRPHYALTLRNWVARLEAQQQEAVRIVGPARYRVWRLYMTACALQFEQGALGVYQILASRRGGQEPPVPLSRRDLYSATR